MRTSLYNFFFFNYELVLFVYGLAFFTLGLAVAMQSRSRSRLELAHSLRWLALFGITHGLHEWTVLLLPMYALGGSGTMITILQIVRVLLLGGSYAALFAFGTDLLRGRWSRLPWLPLLVTGVWAAWLLWRSINPAPDMNLWQQASIWARYFIGFPGAMLAAVGLRLQAERQIRPLGLEHIYRLLYVAGIALGAYAVVGGLVVPPGSFFPANTLNASVLVETTGVPAPVFRSLVGLVLAISVIRALEVFEVETDRLLARMESEQKLAAERERIGREIHDGALQQVYTAGLLVETMEPILSGNSVASERLKQAMGAMNEAIRGLRKYMSDLRVAPSATSLAEGLRQQAVDPRLAALVDVQLSLQLPEESDFSAVQTAHILSIVNEALTNVVRHARAQQVQVRAVVEEGMLYLNVEDDGLGLIWESEGRGYGLRNMEERARLLGGELLVSSQPGAGTRVTLVAPWACVDESTFWEESGNFSKGEEE